MKVGGRNLVGICLALVASVPVPVTAQSVERGVYGGVGSARSESDRVGESGDGVVLLAGVTWRRSDRVFLDLDVMYGRRNFELAQGRLPFRGTDVSLSTGFGILLLTDVPVQPFLGAGVGLLHSANQVRPEATIPVPALIASATESAIGPFVQLGGGARIFAMETLFFQAEWNVLLRVADRLPERWSALTVAAGYSF